MSRGPDPGPTTPGLPEGVTRVREPLQAGVVPLHPHPGWASAFPWLAQGTTGRGDGGFDLGLFGDQPVGPALGRWRGLREALGMPAAVHAHQVHGAEILHHAAVGTGLLIAEGYDGHVTDRSAMLLTVSVADCVPIFVVDPDRRRIALLHGGWRGTAAGVVGRGVAAIAGDGGAARLHVHLGPAICGRCYEVGPEVHAALGLEPPQGRAPVDVRAVQAAQASAAGVDPERITVSEHCTRCGEGFYSHRAGDAGRQLGVLGIRP